MPKDITTRKGNPGKVLALSKKTSTSSKTGEVFESYVGSIEMGNNLLTIIVKPEEKVYDRGKYAGQPFLSCTVIKTAKVNKPVQQSKW